MFKEFSLNIPLGVLAHHPGMFGTGGRGFVIRDPPINLLSIAFTPQKVCQISAAEGCREKAGNVSSAL